MLEGKLWLNTFLVASTSITMTLCESHDFSSSENWFCRQGQTALCCISDATWQTVVKRIPYPGSLLTESVSHITPSAHPQAPPPANSILFPSAPSLWIPRIHETGGQLGMKLARHKCVTFPRLSASHRLSPSWLSVNKCNAAAELLHGCK